MASHRKENKDYIVDAFLEGRGHVFINELPHPEAVPAIVKPGAFGGAPVLARNRNHLILKDPDDEDNIKNLFLVRK